MERTSPSAMPTISSYSDYQPITWFRRMPIYVTTVLAALLVFGMLATTIFASADVDVLTWAAFSMPTFFAGYAWQLFTYPFVAQPDFFFLFSVLFFYFAGIEVEKYLGRRRYAKLLILLLLVEPLMLIAQHFLKLGDSFCYGSTTFTAALFIAFATLYPNLEYFSWVPLKWIAFACLFISSLSYLPRHQWFSLATLWIMCGTSFGYIRLLQRGGSVEFASYFGRMFKRRPKLRVVRSTAPMRAAAPARSRAKPEEKDVIESIDPLLDKISEHGLASLTAREREKLERARAALLKKSSD
jgi:membrane associated rhomboid family serine protease